MLTVGMVAGPAPAAASSGLTAARVDAVAFAHLQRMIWVDKRAVPPQYHDITSTVSSKKAASISVWKCCQVAQPISHQTSRDGRSEQSNQAREPQNGAFEPVAGQYQGDELMLQIGLVLGMAYLAFLAIWIWATRLRPH
jgi:hypothetical protein